MKKGLLEVQAFLNSSKEDLFFGLYDYLKETR